ncbi:MAG: glycosyltransferase family 4 protein [Leptolinea sp.]|jgi:1,2-diacylglycerol 3-alpha-glucosyltransferase|nr:glycosyltransferase family 4 protein [Leptolinea sp.]
MRILITGCTYFPSRNGQSIFMINLAEGLADQGNKVMVVLPTRDGHPKKFERNGVDILEMKSLDLGQFHADASMTFFADKEVNHILDDFRPDVIHIHDHYPLSNTFVRIGMKRHIKLVGTNHFVPDNLAPYVPGSSHFFSLLSKVMWNWMLMTFNHLDFATAPSRTAAQILREQKIKLPVYPISCGVNTKRFKPDPEIDRASWRKRFGLDTQKPAILFVGRVDAEKKIDLLINALKIRGKDDVQLVIIGNGSHRKHLEQISRHFGMEKQVHFLGFVADEDLPSLINSTDIFAMPSEAELLSIASLEAMACGKPLLLANARALPELLHDGVNGYLFDAGKPEDAAKKIDLFLSNPDTWTAMGNESLKMVQMHTLENTIAGYSMLYYALVAGNTLPNPQTEWLRIRPGAASLKNAPTAN